MNRRVATLVSVGLVAATLAPAVRAPDEDGFPLSTFPMFAAPRPTEVVMSYAQGVTGGGRLRALSPDQLGTGEVMQAFAMIQRAVDAGSGACNALCGAIAARVAADAEYRDVVAIRIVTGTHDAVDYLARRAIGRERTRASCDVRRSTR
jgi:hypothetical protein